MRERVGVRRANFRFSYFLTTISCGRRHSSTSHIEDHRFLTWREVPQDIELFK